MSTDNSHAAVEEFKTAVNVSPKALLAWLNTSESKAVGSKTTENSESVGHRSGKKIVALLGKPEAEFTSGDIAHARKVVGYIHRHLGTAADWRYRQYPLALFADELGPRSATGQLISCPVSVRCSCRSDACPAASWRCSNREPSRPIALMQIRLG